MSDPTRQIAPDIVESTVKFLLSVTDLQVKGDYNFDPHIDWIKQANSLPPGAFSKFFDGEVKNFRDSTTQSTPPLPQAYPCFLLSEIHPNSFTNIKIAE
jgi:hypothetical protein